MLQELTARVAQGDRLFQMLLRAKYEESVGENDSLTQMMSEKSFKDLKKGDRIVLPFAEAVGDEAEVEISDGEMFAEQDTDCGFRWLSNFRSQNSKPEGKRDIPVDNPKSV